MRKQLFSIFDIAELKIHVSPQTKDVLDKFETFDLKQRRKSVALKVSGEINIVSSKV